MKKEAKIKEIEDKQSELKNEFKNIISQPINDESIKIAENRGSEIISESMSNDIILDILNWDDNTKLSKTGLKFKNNGKLGTNS